KLKPEKMGDPMSSLWSTKEKGAREVQAGIGDVPVWDKEFSKEGKVKTHHNVAKHIDLSEQATRPNTAKGLEEAAEASKRRLPATVDMTERAKMDWTKTQPAGPSVGFKPGEIHPETGQIVKGALPEARVVIKEARTVAKGAKMGLEVAGKVI